MNTTATLRVRRDDRQLASRSLARLRAAYFAHAADSASRYGVTFDRLVQHLWEARRHDRQLLVRSVRYVDDLVHAVACIDDVGLAWADLSERYERPLMRRCRIACSEMDALIIVRRLLADLRRSESTRLVIGHWSLVTTHQPPITKSQPPAPLRAYAGARPLRLWLHERLEMILTRRALNRMRQQVSACRGNTLKLSG